MRFLIDADLSPRLVELFAARGHDALHVDSTIGGTAKDPVVAAAARRARRCIFTGDFDFADIRLFDPRLHDGIVVVTLPSHAGPVYIQAVTGYFLDQLPALGPLTGKLLIVELGRIRVRD